jgi:two-component system response regulator VicR
MSKTILVVDDEKAIVDVLTFNLKKEGYDVIAAYDGESALEAAAQKPDLILLDVMLPKLSGFDVCREIRKTDIFTPIIMLTARAEETDKVLGLEIGADDYITKPFAIREVLARVKANIRRTNLTVPAESAAPAQPGIVVDTERYDVWVNGKRADVTQREFDLLRFLAAHPGKVFSREELLREVWQYDYLGDLRAVDVAVRRLREKVEEDPARPVHILTKRGVGYYFEP